MPYAIYIASVAGAVALLLMMPRRGYNPRNIGALVGAVALGGLWLYLARSLPEKLDLAHPALFYYYIFSAIAIGSAVRVITHTKPVFAALWFVMLVCATAGLSLILGGEFVAVALVIIYGGAILVTYVFVIMLAAQAGDPQDLGELAEPGKPGDSVAEYDRVAREPAGAVAAGFLLLAMLLTVMFDGKLRPNDLAAGKPDETVIHQYLPNRTANRLAGQPGAAMTGDFRLDNVEAVGFDLFQSHPLGLELAGVILLVSLVGAVVIARKRVEAEVEVGEGEESSLRDNR